MPRTKIGRLVALVIILVAGLCGCAHAVSTAVPYLPPSYYDCIEVPPDTLVNNYFGPYGNRNIASENFDNQVFVFKNVKVTDDWFVNAAEGYIYINVIKCDLSNSVDIKRFKTGDKVDVIGVNEGVLSVIPAALEFKDCVILPAGTIQLPAGGAATFTSIY